MTMFDRNGKRVGLEDKQKDEKAEKKENEKKDK
jgi:hypothetical protein